MDLSALTTSQAQPEPKRVVAAALKAALRPFSPSRPPKAFWMASPRAPTGSPPPFGEMMFQKKVWLAWPPALLRTAVRMDSGTLERSAMS